MRAELLVIDEVGLEQVECKEASRSGLMQKVLLPRYNEHRSRRLDLQALADEPREMLRASTGQSSGANVAEERRRLSRIGMTRPTYGRIRGRCSVDTHAHRTTTSISATSSEQWCHRVSSAYSQQMQDSRLMGEAAIPPRTNASTHAWFNGNISRREAGAPSVASISFHLGTGVFDGLMAYWNRDHYYLHRARAHLARFRQGANRMGLSFSWTIEDLLSGIHDLLAHEPQTTQYVRPIAYRRAPELWVTGSQHLPVDVSIFTVKVQRDIDAPIRCHVSPIERISSRSIPGHTKVSGAYVNSFNARRTAEIAGFEDGIMLDREGRIAEASAANFFMIAENRLLTPPINPDVFPGITRQVILEVADHLGIATEVVNLRPTDLARADAAFLCSTLMEIRPISKINEHTIPTTRHEAYRGLLDSFRNLTRQ